MRVSGQLATDDAVAWIGVQSPSMAHRMESVPAGVFQIGSGSTCHLRLGDECIPDVLALIIADRQQARISCQAASPQLLLNGGPIQDSPLSDGDILEAGPYTLVFRRLQTAVVAVKPDDEVCTEPSALSAKLLVDRLEDEFATLEVMERTPSTGIREMMSRMADAPVEADDTPDVIPIDDVRSLLRVLEQGQHRLRLQQEEILQQLDRLTRQNEQIVAALRLEPDGVVPMHSRMRRASA